MGNKKIVICKYLQGILVGIFEHDKVVELLFESKKESSYNVGNIYIGKVQKVVKNINAAFINLGTDFPCYYSIKKDECIKQGDEVLVQIQKEGVKTKVPTVSSNLNFTGKYLVLTKNDCRIAVSKKITGAKKQELLDLMSTYKNDAYGFIVRTNAKEVDLQILKDEAEVLKSEYEELMRIYKTRTIYSCLRVGSSPCCEIVRDMKMDDLDQILVDDKETYEDLCAILQREEKSLIEKIHFYEDEAYPLIKLASLETAVKEATQKKVWMKSGAYLVIEPTEALTVVDVNSGKCVTKKDKEDQYFKINVEAAIEVAYQIRLRNISGIIIVDFINLENREKMQEVLKIFKEHLQNDRIKATLIDVTKLQLVEVTRQKIRKSFKESIVDCNE